MVPCYHGDDPSVTPLPSDNKILTPADIEARKNWLFGLSPKARAARYRVVEHVAYLKIALTEEEKLDRQYLKTLHTPDNYKN